MVWNLSPSLSHIIIMSDCCHTGESVSALFQNFMD